MRCGIPLAYTLHGRVRKPYVFCIDCMRKRFDPVTVMTQELSDAVDGIVRRVVLISRIHRTFGRNIAVT